MEEEINDEKIISMINNDSTLLCLFRENFLIEQYEEDMSMELLEKDNPEYEDFALRRLEYFLTCCVNFIATMRYPKKYEKMLREQLNQLRDIDDSDRVARNKIVNNMIGFLNVRSGSTSYYQGFLASVFDALSIDLSELNIDENKKKEKLDFIRQSKEKLLEITDNDDPDNSLKIQIYNDVYSELMPSVEEALKFSNDDPYLDFMEIVTDIHGEVRKFKNDGLDVYKEQLDCRKLPYDDDCLNDIDALVETIIKWAEYERYILLTHIHYHYFDMSPEELEPFVDSPNYYKAVQNIILQHEEILYNYAFIDNVRKIISSKDDINHELRKELGLLLALTDEHCFDDCEQFAINYSKDKKFYEYLKRMLEKYKCLSTDEVFLKNVRHVMGLNRVRARLSLGKKLYRELV